MTTATTPKLYVVTPVAADLLKGKFGEQAQNDAIVAELDATLVAMKEEGILSGGPFAIKFDGPASLPVAACLTHHLAHLYDAVAVRDPKVAVPGDQSYEMPDGRVIMTVLGSDGKPVPAYIVAVAHGDRYKVGQIIA